MVLRMKLPPVDDGRMQALRQRKPPKNFVVDVRNRDPGCLTQTS
jgi:hypothetical protein